MGELSTPCIEWTKAKANGGYGVTSRDGRLYRVHRLEWERVHGAIPDGMLVCHSCDNPPCYNVDHLFLGTHADNMRDMDTKGRRKGPPKRTHCLRGHLLPESRRCLECEKIRKRRCRTHCVNGHPLPEPSTLSKRVRRMCHECLAETVEERSEYGRGAAAARWARWRAARPTAA